MTLDQRDLFARAFALRRAVLPHFGTSGEGVPRLNGCDALLLSLVLDRENIGSLRIQDSLLAAALCDAFGKSNRSGAPTISAGKEDKHVDLELVHFGQGLEDDHTRSLVLVCDLPGDLPLPTGNVKTRLWLSPLAFLFPAAWSSRMAWLSSADTRKRTREAQRRLSDVLPRDELDPLFLIDELQTTRSSSSRTSSEPEDLRARCLELEQRVRELETSGLVRYQSLLGDAARRRRFGG